MYICVFELNHFCFGKQECLLELYILKSIKIITILKFVKKLFTLFSHSSSVARLRFLFKAQNPSDKNVIFQFWIGDYDISKISQTIARWKLPQTFIPISTREDSFCVEKKIVNVKGMLEYQTTLPESIRNNIAQ